MITPTEGHELQNFLHLIMLHVEQENREAARAAMRDMSLRINELTVIVTSAKE